jgi:hypothetical protein
MTRLVYPPICSTSGASCAIGSSCGASRFELVGGALARGHRDPSFAAADLDERGPHELIGKPSRRRR